MTVINIKEGVLYWAKASFEIEGGKSFFYLEFYFTAETDKEVSTIHFTVR
jgi:hypothetical protein